MKKIVKYWLPDSLQPYAQVASRRTRTWGRRLDYFLDSRTLSQEEFINHLQNLGIFPGATIYLHSSMDKLMRRVPSLNTFACINLLKELLTDEGTLLVPTFPFLGSQYHYVQRQRLFNVQRTPSAVGLFTELFRRTAGVTRSLHPTHPIAAWGRHSKELVAEHHLGTAFGKTSPVYKMQQYYGRVVGIGVMPRHCFTLFHMAEELHPCTRAMQYSSETLDMIIIHGQEKIPYRVTPLRPRSSNRVRNYGRAERILRREGILRYYRVKGLQLSVTLVCQFLQKCQKLIDANLFYSHPRV